MDLLMFPPMLDIGTTFTTIFKNMGWLVFATAALMISVVTGSLAYMASEALNLAKLKTWAKSELYEAVMNAAIIATTASVLVLLSALAGALTGYPDLYVPGELFLNTMDSTVTSVYVSLLAKEAWIGFLSTAGTSIYIGQPGITTVTLSVVPMSGMTVISDALITIIDAVGISLAAIIVQQVILSFFKETMLTFFLPAGIALRGLPVTRRLGSSLIAFALACYFVYPMSLILNQAIYENSDPINFQSYQNLIDICDKNKGGFSSFLDWLKDKTTVTNDSYFGQTVQHEEPGIFFKIVKWFGNLIKSTIAALQTVASFTSEFFYLFIDVRRASAQIYSLVIEQMTPAMQFMVFSIFVPILNIIVTVTAYRSLASALGGEEEIFGLSKIV